MRRLARTPVIFLAIFSFSDDSPGLFGGGRGDGGGDDFSDGGEVGGTGLETGPAPPDLGQLVSHRPQVFDNLLHVRILDGSFLIDLFSGFGIDHSMG